jgi:hypothetical protein
MPTTIPSAASSPASTYWSISPAIILWTCGEQVEERVLVRQTTFTSLQVLVDQPPAMIFLVLLPPWFRVAHHVVGDPDRLQCFQAIKMLSGKGCQEAIVTQSYLDAP